MGGTLRVGPAPELVETRLAPLTSDILDALSDRADCTESASDSQGSCSMIFSSLIVFDLVPKNPCKRCDALPLPSRLLGLLLRVFPMKKLTPCVKDEAMLLPMSLLPLLVASPGLAAVGLKEFSANMLVLLHLRKVLTLPRFKKVPTFEGSGLLEQADAFSSCMPRMLRSSSSFFNRVAANSSASASFSSRAWTCSSTSANRPSADLRSSTSSSSRVSMHCFQDLSASSMASRSFMASASSSLILIASSAASSFALAVLSRSSSPCRRSASSSLRNAMITALASLRSVSAR
mmetsp:Transcript_38958/g.116410  ORF Transcript_38958/g.116410 Transcript_38958/m.116410 type:complete len:291 (+) Transcript_38958:76-948(+)